MKILRSLLLLLSACFAVVSFAVMPQTVPGPAFTLITNANVGTLTGVRADLANFTKLSYEAGVIGGGVNVRGTTLMPIVNRSPTVIDVFAHIPKASVVSALGRFFVKTLPIISTMSAVYQLGEDLGFNIDNSSGQFVFKKATPVPGNSTTACTVAPCVNWSFPATGMPGANATPGPGQTVCDSNFGALAAYYNPRVSGPIIFNSTQANVGYCGAYLDGTYRSNLVSLNPSVGSPVDLIPDSTTLTPATLADFMNAVDVANPARVADVIADAIKNGESFDLTASMSGPASTPGGSTVTQNANAQTTTTSTTTNHYTYAGDTVTLNQTTNNITTDSVTGAVLASSSTATTPDIPQPVDPCIEHPERIGCSVYGTPDAPQLPKIDSGFSGITPVVFGSNAACPSDLTFNVLGHQQSISYSGACSALDTYIKPLLLLLSVALSAWIFVGGFKV
jgi:hypothetical protein